MADAIIQPRKRRGLRIVVWAVSIVLLLLIVAYFFFTSGAFFKAVIVPKIGQTIRAEVSVTDASIHPFSHVSISGLRVRTTGDEPVLTAKTISARYSLLDMIRGKINVDEILVDSPVIHLVKNPDGTSNLDPILESMRQQPEPSPEPARPSQPAQVHLKRLAVQNGTFRSVEKFAGDRRNVVEVSELNLAVTDIQNGQAGKINLGARLRMDNNPPAPNTNGFLEAKLEGNLGVTLSPDLQPTALLGNTRLGVEKAQGALADLANLAADLVCEVTPKEVKMLALRFKKGATDLGEVRVSGPFDAAAREGTLRLDVVSIDRQVLNLAGAASGLEFRDAAVNATNVITLARGGNQVTAQGEVKIDRLSVSQQGQTIPTLDMRLQYNTTVDQSNQVAQLHSFTLSATQNGQPLLRGELTRPMTLAWGPSAQGVGDSTLRFIVTNFHLADWQGFLGGLASAGDVQATLDLLAKQAGKQLNLDLNSEVQGLTASVGSNQLTQVNARLLFRGQVTDFSKIHLEQTRLELTRAGQAVVSASTSGDYDLESQVANLLLAMDASLPGLLAAMPQPGMTFSSGKAGLEARVTQTKEAQTVAGTLKLDQLTGTFDPYRFADLGVSTDLDTEIRDQTVKIRKLHGALRRGNLPGGTFDLTGSHQLEKEAGEMTLRLSDLNQNFLEPFLAPLLTNLTLVSVSLGGNSSVTYAPTGDATVKADALLTNLVVKDPQQTKPLPPLEAALKLDATMAKHVLNLSQLQLNLTPTDRAQNQVQLTGKLDMSDTNATQGQLKLAADALDLTRYYDLFVAPSMEAPAPPPPTETKPTTNQPPQVETESEPMSLPFKEFILDMDVGRLYLREVLVTNWHATLKLDRTNIVLNPFQLNLNGAPVSMTADVNTGVPGYKYDIKANTGQIPIEPLVNTFMPEDKGRYKGDLTVQTAVKGIGSTGKNLRQHLQGRFDLGFTNAVVQVVAPKYSRLLAPLYKKVNLPRIVERYTMFFTPVAAALRLPELMKSPLTELSLVSEMGAGKFDYKLLHITSPAFVASTSGQIQIEDVLNNSKLADWPMRFELSRPLAEKTKLMPSNTPTNATYVQLPTFIGVAGTLDSPKPKLDLKALVVTGIDQYVDKIPGVDQQKADMIKSVTGLLGGKTSQTNKTDQTTNQPAQKFNPLDLFKKKPQ